MVFQTFSIFETVGNRHFMAVFGIKNFCESSCEYWLQRLFYQASFGMEVPNRSGGSESYRYGFNGKEEDNEIKGDGNSYDFGERMYDPRVGRWFRTDKLEKKYPSISPYVAFGNDPINVIDPDGNELIEIIIKTKSPYIKGQLRIVVDKEIAGKVKELIKYAIDNKIYVHINSDFRTTKEQSTSIQKTGVTPAKPGNSRHEGGFALDFQLYKDNSGKSSDIISKKEMANLKDNDFINKAEELGFRWGGDFKKPDGVHIDAWPAGESKKFGYSSWKEAYNENQNDFKNNTIEKDIFSYDGKTTEKELSPTLTKFNETMKEEGSKFNRTKSKYNFGSKKKSGF